MNSAERILCLQSLVLMQFLFLFSSLGVFLILLLGSGSQRINTLRVIIDRADHANFHNCTISKLGFLHNNSDYTLD